MSQHIAETLDNKGQLDVIYTDLSKALDKVDHQILLNKLSMFGLSNCTLNLFISYLFFRTNFVYHKGYTSTFYVATSSIPQGSTLGPLLLILYINDVVSVIEHSLILMFADDVKLFRKISNPLDCMLLQDDGN